MVTSDLPKLGLGMVTSDLPKLGLGMVTSDLPKLGLGMVTSDLPKLGPQAEFACLLKLLYSHSGMVHGKELGESALKF